MKSPLKTLLILLPLVLAPALTANLIVNGSFETGDETGWTFVPSESNSRYVVLPTQEGFGYAAQDGACAGAFSAMEDMEDILYQEFSTVAGRSYFLDFWVRSSAISTGSTMMGCWNEISLGSCGDHEFPVTSNAGAFDWTRYSYTLLATGAQSRLSFSGMSNAEWIMLDNVSVTEVAQLKANSVPDAGSTVLLLALGLFSTAMVRRCRGFAEKQSGLV